MWDSLGFSKFTKSITFDLPGHGDSIAPISGELTMLGIAKLVKQELDAIGIDKYTLIGHSLGGYIGVELMKMDESCENLIFLNSNFWEDSTQKKIDRKRIAEIVKYNKTSFIYEAIPHLFLNPEKYHVEVVSLINEAKVISAKTIADYSIAMSKREDNISFVRENATKIMIIQGEDDAIVSVDKMDSFFTEIGFNYKRLSQCGHMSHVEKKEEVIEIVLQFLNLN